MSKPVHDLKIKSENSSTCAALSQMALIVPDREAFKAQTQKPNQEFLAIEAYRKERRLENHQNSLAARSAYRSQVLTQAKQAAERFSLAFAALDDEDDTDMQNEPVARKLIFN